MSRAASGFTAGTFGAPGTFEGTELATQKSAGTDTTSGWSFFVPATIVTRCAPATGTPLEATYRNGTCSAMLVPGSIGGTGAVPVKTPPASVAVAANGAFGFFPRLFSAMLTNAIGCAAAHAAARSYGLAAYVATIPGPAEAATGTAPRI